MTLQINLLLLAIILSALFFFAYKLSKTKIGGSKILASLITKISPWIIREANESYSWQPEAQNTYFDEKLVRKNVWGYVDKHSITPGESFLIMSSTAPEINALTGRIAIYKVTGKTEKNYLWNSEKLTIKTQNTLATSSAIGANWIPSAKVETTEDWKSGYYAIDFISDNDNIIPDIAYIVVTNPNLDGNILIKLGTNTYQAYNRWGGSSFYDEGGKSKASNMISFDRPTPADFYRWDFYLVKWLEELGETHNIAIDYATNFDIHKNPKITENYPLIIVSGHDEYWSHEEYENFYQRIYVHGKNTLFFGGNLAHYKIRYQDLNNHSGDNNLGRQILVYKESEQDPIIFRGDQYSNIQSQRFDSTDKPSRLIIGLSYSGWFQPKSAFSPAFTMYAGSKLPFLSSPYQENEIVGDLVGYEWDSTNGTEKNFNLPSWTNQFKTYIAPVFHGSGIDKSGEKRLFNSVFYQTHAGANVFSAGTINWNWGLSKEGFMTPKFRQFNESLIFYMLNSTHNRGN